MKPNAILHDAIDYILDTHGPEDNRKKALGFLLTRIRDSFTIEDFRQVLRKTWPEVLETPNP